MERSGGFEGSRPSRGDRWRVRSPAARSGALAVALTVGVLVPTLGVWLGRNGWALGLGLGREIEVVAAVVCGAVSLITWRVTGNAAPAWLGAAWLTDAAATLAAADAGSVGGPLRTVTVLPVARFATALVVVAILWKAIGVPDEVGVQPANRALVVSVVVGLVLVEAYRLVVVLGAARPAAPDTGAALEIAAAAAWIGFLLRGAGVRDRGGPVPAWVEPAALLFAAGELLRSLVLADGSEWAFAADAVTLLAFAVVLCFSARSLQQELVLLDRHARQLLASLTQAHARLAREARANEDRRHELRNAMGAVRAADRTLRRCGTSLDDGTRQSLADAITAELDRVGRLIEARDAEQRSNPPPASCPAEAPSSPAAFGLAESLRPVVVAERALGSQVTLDVGEVQACGDGAELAQVVQNLLVNARRYAWGTVVTVRATAHGARVRIVVEDGGPGVPEPERDAIFGRGARGSASGGTRGDGLGLAIAREVVERMGGGLWVAGGEGRGASFVLDLPGPAGGGRPEAVAAGPAGAGEVARSGVAVG